MPSTLATQASMPDNPTSPVSLPNKLSVHSVDIVGILFARYLFLSNVEVILWERQIALLELEFRWSSSFT